MPGRVASHNVQILWKKGFELYTPLQFLCIIEYVEDVPWENLLNFNRLHFCGLGTKKHNILWSVT